MDMHSNINCEGIYCVILSNSNLSTKKKQKKIQTIFKGLQHKYNRKRSQDRLTLHIIHFYTIVHACSQFFFIVRKKIYILQVNASFHCKQY